MTTQGLAHPEWILVPWPVFAFALALNVWQFGSALKRELTVKTRRTDQFRQSLERIWAQEKVDAKWTT
jgi:hypothetical protein